SAFGDAATRDLADLGDVEHLKDLGITDERLATLWRQQTGHSLLNVVDEIVDAVVVAHLDADVVSRRARLLVGTNVEADDHGTRSLGERDVAFRDGTCASMYDTRLNLVGTELVERCHDGFDRTLHVALDNQRELLEAAGLELRHHLLQRTALASLTGNRLVACKTLTVLRDFASTGFVLDH